MKAKNWIKYVFFGAAVLLFAEGLIAQTCASPAGAGFRLPSTAWLTTSVKEQEKKAPLYLQNILLPEWRAADLPFFCRIEHHWGKKLPTTVKFRLGSVDYVDWLEGKSHFATFAP